MANVLSQEEIDALLGGLSGGQIETSESAQEKPAQVEDIHPFDFSDQDRYLRGRMPTLETIHDRFARLLRQSLSTSLRRGVEIQICSQTICSFSDFSRSLEKPSSLHILKLDPLKGSGLLVLPARLIMTLVDLMFGGEGKPIEVTQDRDFTLIESRVIAKVAEDICKAYTESWMSVKPLHVSLGGAETNILFVNIAQPNDPVNVVDCDVIIEGCRSSMSICIPYAVLDPIKDILRGNFVGDNLDLDNATSRQMRALLMDANVALRALLGTATITGRDLIRLKPGDIIQLNEDYEHPVEIEVEGVRKFWGTVGAHKSTRALQVTAFEEQIKRN